MDDVLAGELVIPQHLLFSVTPSGAMQLSPATEIVPVVDRELLPLLLLFARARSLESALAEARGEWEIAPEEFVALVRAWCSSGLLVAAAERTLEPTRLTIFKNAMAAYRMSGSARFPLSSHFPLQRPLLFYPGLNTRELHDAARYPWTRALEEAFPDIRREVLGLLETDPRFKSVNQNYTATGEWAAAYLWIFGEAIEEIVARCPTTARVLSAIPGVTKFGTSLFSALSPGTFLSPHHGYTNAKLRCQLPLIVPPDCRLKIGDAEVEQQEGRCIVFDDSFLHSAWNASEEVRIVLVLDFFHPDLTEEEISYFSELTQERKLGAPYKKQMESATADWLQAPR